MRYQPGDTVGPYRVTGIIGEGATGVVYQVVNSVTGRLDAMKILADSFAHDLDQAQRFLREIQLQAKLNHPNIAQVRTAFCEGSTIVLIMELVDGESLSTVLTRGPLSPGVSVRVIQEVLNALVVAHHHGVVHRDVKPANILVDRAGNVKLTDFGLAKKFGEPGQTAQGMAVGTVYYMAPEQVRGLAATDWRADLYAAGIVLYEMLTGRKPFDGAEQFTVMRAHIEQTPVPVTRWVPTLPPALDTLIDRALQKDPANRFQSASGFLAALQALPLTAAPQPKMPWQYATYAAGLGALLMAAFAIPPSFAEPPLDTIPLKMPSAPAVPPDALRLSAPPVELPVETVPAPKPPPVLIRRAKPFTATRIVNTDPPEPIDPPPAKPVQPNNTFLPTPPKVTIPNSEPPTTVAPVAQPELPTAKPQNWMRRNIGRVPKIFRRREDAPVEKP